MEEAFGAAASRWPGAKARQTSAADRSAILCYVTEDKRSVTKKEEKRDDSFFPQRCNLRDSKTLDSGLEESRDAKARKKPAGNSPCRAMADFDLGQTFFAEQDNEFTRNRNPDHTPAIVTLKYKEFIRNFRIEEDRIYR